MKTINVLGITLKDYSLREAMRLTERFLNSGGLSVVACASAKQLIKASSDAAACAWWEQLDLTVYADADILKHTEGVEAGRIREIEQQEYLRELFKRLARGRFGIYLLAPTQEKLRELEAELIRYQDSLRIAGRSAMEDYGGSQEQIDSLINEINGVTPKIIVARLPFEAEREFVENNRMKINADMFLGLCEMSGLKKSGRACRSLMEKIYRSILKRRIMREKKREKAE